MNIIQPSVRVMDWNNIMQNIELGGRVCYRSEDKMCEGSDVALIEKLLNFKHESVLEHGVITMNAVCDRGVSHELVRQRLASPSQESTRYCNYSKGKFGSEITVIEPFFYTRGSTRYRVWEEACIQAGHAYLRLVQEGSSAQEARSVLPNSLKTELQITANVREFRHILNIRTHRDAHPQMRQIMIPLLRKLAELWPVLFAEIVDKNLVGCNFPPEHEAMVSVRDA